MSEAPEARPQRFRTRRWIRIAVALAVVGACVAVVRAATHEEQPLTRRGVQLHPFWSDTTTRDVERELDMTKAAGADTVRIDLSWSTLEFEGKGRRSADYIAKVDRFFEQARSRDLRVIATFWSTPCWASTAPAERKQGCRGRWWERGVQRYPPQRASDYADAATWVARRWGDHMDALEIWNEPNLPAFMRSPQPARAYAAIVKSAYPQIKDAAPGLPVLAGAMSLSDGMFLTALYDEGIKGNYDGLSYHPYGDGRDPSRLGPPSERRYSFRRGTRWLRDIQAAHGDSATPLWQTEVGFTTCTAAANRPCVTESQQSDYVAEVFRIVRDEMPFVRAVIVYNLRNKGTDPADVESQFGLLERDFRPKLGYRGLERALRG